MRNKCEFELKKLTGKKYIVFTNRCNESILASLKLAKSLSYIDIYTPDQGGWMIYSQYIKKLKLNEHRVRTDDGLFESFKTDSVLLLHSMPAYVALQDMTKLSAKLLINDVCGSIGTQVAKVGDIIVCSFGRWKPINLGGGGMIATDNEKFYDFFKQFDVELDFASLYDKIVSLQSRLDFLRQKVTAVKNELSDFNIVHKDKSGLNVIVKFSSDVEKEKLINYCKNNNYEFVICPMYIRVLDDAVSIEVKRLEKI